MLSIRKVRLLITSRYIAMQSYECVIISKMFLIYFISYGCNGGALVFLGGAEASASPSFALPMFITIKKIIILHLFLGVGGTGTPWHTRGYAPGCHSLEVPFSLLKKGVSQYFCPYNECTSHWCLGIRLWLKVCIMQIMTWLSADQSSSSTLTESSFIVDPCLIHRDTVMLE